MYILLVKPELDLEIGQQPDAFQCWLYQCVLEMGKVTLAQGTEMEKKSQ